MAPPRWTGLATFSSVFLRLALGISFLSAVADRFGLWGACGQPNVSWGDYAQFVDYTAKLNWFLPAATIPALAVIATAAETLFGLLLVLGWNTRIVALLSGGLLTIFALTMTVALGVKAPLNFSVFSAAAGALLLGARADFPLSVDEALRRTQGRREIVLNDPQPRMNENPERYEVRADGQLVIEQTLREDALPGPSRGYARDTITLGWEDRLHVRGRRRSDGGVGFGLWLPQGTMLRGGDCLVVEEAKTVVVVMERPEPVFLIEPRTPQEWGLYAYHIGNGRQPVMIAENGIVCPDVADVEQVLEQRRIPFARTTLAFTPATSPAGDHHG